MKKKNEKKTREITGGRWKCNNCGLKTLSVSGMHLHLAVAHGAYNLPGDKTSGSVK